MTGAPLRTTTTQTERTPSIKTHGHLALLEWEETLPVPDTPKSFGPHKKSLLDRCYEGGTLVLLAVTAAALAAAL